VVLQGWTPWCRECEWGVNPAESLPVSATRRRWQRRVDAATVREHAELVARAASPPPRHPLNRVAIAMAVAIHTVTVVLIVVAVGIWFVDVVPVIKYVVSPVTALVILAITPVRRRRSDDRPGWSRADAPSLFALIDEVAAGISAPPPHRVVVDAGFNASVSRSKQLRVLTIGLPLWEVLDDGGRLSLLAHELGHEVNGDIRNDWLIRTARVSLNKWQELLWPGTTPGMRHSMRARQYLRGQSAGDMVIANAIMAILLAPLYAATLTIGEAFNVCVSRSSQRAEYRADRMAVDVAGSEATARLFDVLLCSDLLRFAAEVAARGGASDVLPHLPAMLADVPESEHERLRRRGHGVGRRVDPTHPPTSLRAAYAAAVSSSGAHLVDEPMVLTAATAELRRRSATVERSLRARAR
jgi:Zn-dependent protease with chaperone function